MTSTSPPSPGTVAPSGAVSGAVSAAVPAAVPSSVPGLGRQTRRAAQDADRARDDERRQLERVRADLVREFAGRLGEQEVQRRFAENVARFEGAPIRSFVPVLARRHARLDLAGAPGPGGAGDLPGGAVPPVPT